MTEARPDSSGIRVTLILVALFAIALGLIFFAKHRAAFGPEPVYSGRKFSWWFNQMDPEALNRTNSAVEIMAAFRGMGAAAVPFLAQRAAAPEPSSSRLQRMMSRAWPGARSFWNRPRADERWQNERAVWCLGELGPVALPALKVMTNIQTLWTKAPMFGAWARIEPANPVPVQELCRLMKSPQQPDRYFAALGLGHCDPALAGVVETLIAGLQDHDLEVRANSAEALRLIGPGARAAIPALQRAASVATYARLEVNLARALWKIDSSQNDLAAKTLGRTLKGKNFDSWNALKYLMEMGPAARAAIPDLIEYAPRDRETQRRRNDFLKLLQDRPAP